jgi:4-diphosphocytidyl-2-C-methyl-D-erythritol kinase
MGGSVRRDAPAKVNLFLRVGALTSTGYHELETLFATLDLADEVVVETAPVGTLELSVDGDVGGVTPEENLVYRAASWFFRYTAGFGSGVDGSNNGHVGGARVELTKRIPAGGGLGGGSSDAAATLLALNELYGEPLSHDQLHEIGRQLGADIPFFLDPCSFALGRGRGDVLTHLTPLPPVPVVLGLPQIHVATAEAYRRLDHQREAAPEADLGGLSVTDGLDWTAVAAQSRNDFEPVVHTWYPELGELFGAFEATDPLLCRMSGSGASHFGVYETVAQAEEARAVLSVALPEVHFAYAVVGGLRGADASAAPLEERERMPLP